MAKFLLNSLRATPTTAKLCWQKRRPSRTAKSGSENLVVFSTPVKALKKKLSSRNLITAGFMRWWQRHRMEAKARRESPRSRQDQLPLVPANNGAAIVARWCWRKPCLLTCNSTFAKTRPANCAESVIWSASRQRNTTCWATRWLFNARRLIAKLLLRWQKCGDTTFQFVLESFMIKATHSAKRCLKELMFWSCRFSIEFKTN